MSILSASFLSASCSLQNPIKTPLHIEIPRSSELNRSALHSRTQSTSSNYTTTPSSLSDFDCFAVNVTAPEIAPQAPQPCTLPSDIIGIAGGWVSANPSSTSGNSSSVAIDLMVPTGPDRLIQIYGVRTPDQCPLLGDFKSARLGDIYLIGSVTQDIFDDTDVSIKAQLDISKKVLTSCQSSNTGSGGTLALGSTTYYVLGPTATSITLPLPNSGQYTLASVSATENPTASVADAGDHAHFSYNPNGNRGIDQFTYTATDSSGNTGTGNIIIKNVTPATWTGEYGDHNWSSSGNWCGGVNGSHTACTNTGPVPTTGSQVYFDGTCSPANCSANISHSTTTYSVQLDPDYPGTITASAGVTLTFTHMLDIRGGTININNASSSLNAAQLAIQGGSLISNANSMSLGASYGVTIYSGLLDLSNAASVSLGDLTISGGTLHAPDSGTITYNGAITYTGGTINSGANSTALAVLNNSLSTTISLHLNSPINFQNLQIQSTNLSGSYAMSNTLNVYGTLILDGVYSGMGAPTLSGGPINVQGDLKVDTGFTGYGGALSVLMNGTGHQTITLPSGAYLPHINVSKSGLLTINNANSINLQSLTSTQVEHIGVSELYLPSGQIYVGTFTQNGSGGTSFATSTINGDLQILAGVGNMNGDLHVTGNFNLNTGTTFNKSGHTLTVDLISNILGSIIP